MLRSLPPSVSLPVWILAALALLALVTWLACLVLERRHRPHGRFVDVAGGRLHVVEVGAARGPHDPAVVLIHGASGNLKDMEIALAGRLAERWRVVLIDRPGHGWSTRPAGAGDAAPARQAARVREALRKLGVRMPLIVAHSWSGALATAYALDHPDELRGLVLIAPATHPWDGGIAWYYMLATTPLLGPLFAWTLAFPIGSLLAPGAAAAAFAPQKPPRRYLSRASIMLVLRPRTFLANAQDVARLHAALGEQSQRYGRLALPTVIITGDRDDTVALDVHARALARAIPHARLEILEGVGHMPHHVRPDRIEAAIEEVAAKAGVR